MGVLEDHPLLREEGKPIWGMHEALKGLGGTYASRAGVADFLVETDIQVVSGLVGEEEADGNRLGRRQQADVDLHFCLKDSQLPEAAAVPHHH